MQGGKKAVRVASATYAVRPCSGQGLGQAAEVGLPIVRRSSRQRSQISPYQVGTRDSRTGTSGRTGSSILLVKWASYVTNDH